MTFVTLVLVNTSVPNPQQPKETQSTYSWITPRATRSLWQITMFRKHDSYTLRPLFLDKGFQNVNKPCCPMQLNRIFFQLHHIQPTAQQTPLHLLKWPHQPIMPPDPNLLILFSTVLLSTKLEKLASQGCNKAGLKLNGKTIKPASSGTSISSKLLYTLTSEADLTLVVNPNFTPGWDKGNLQKQPLTGNLSASAYPSFASVIVHGSPKLDAPKSTPALTSTDPNKQNEVLHDIDTEFPPLPKSSSVSGPVNHIPTDPLPHSNQTTTVPLLFQPTPTPSQETPTPYLPNTTNRVVDKGKGKERRDNQDPSLDVEMSFVHPCRCPCSDLEDEALVRSIIDSPSPAHLGDLEEEHDIWIAMACSLGIDAPQNNGGPSATTIQCQPFFPKHPAFMIVTVPVQPPLW